MQNSLTLQLLTKGFLDTVHLSDLFLVFEHTFILFLFSVSCYLLWSLPYPPTFSSCRAFTVTAIAQMCILGLMWVFGAFLFEENATAVVAAYIFTILNSLQGALIFFLHCLLSKQVRYNKWNSTLCFQSFQTQCPSTIIIICQYFYPL